MQRVIDLISNKNGFALIVVLSTLSIIALLFAISSARLLNRTADMATETRLAAGTQEKLDLLGLALGLYGADHNAVAVDQVVTIPTGGEFVELRLQDIGGLIDLNTAAPELLEHLAGHMGMPPESIETYREWRRTPHRLLRVNDFTRVSDLNPEYAQLLRQIATVFSGRRGLSPQDAPSELLTVITGDSGLGAGSIPSAIPENWQTAPTGSTFRVVVSRQGRKDVFIGTIHLGQGDKGRILGVH